MSDKIGILNSTAQEPAARIVQDYCAKTPWDKLCETRVNLPVPEFRHYHIEPVPETPTTFPFPEPSCDTLCVVSYSDTDVELKNNGSDSITVLVVTVSMLGGSAEPVPVWLKAMDSGQTATVPLQYPNGSHVGIIFYYS